MAHAMTNYLKNTLEPRCRDDMEQFFRKSVTAFFGLTHSLHVFIGIFHLDTHQFVNKIVEPCAVRRV